MTEASISSRLLGNSAWNTAVFLASAGLNLLVLPFVVRNLGIAAFGTTGLVAACVTPALIFSNSLAIAASREFAQRLKIERRDDARRVFASAMLLAVIVGGSIMTLLTLVGPPLAGIAFHFSAETFQDLRLAFIFASTGWFCQCLSSVFLSLFVARQDFARISLLNILSASVSTVAMLLLIPLRPTASTFLACQALGCVTTLVGSSIVCCRVLGEWLTVPAFHRAAFDALLRFGIWQVVAQGASLITMQVDRYLLGVLLPPQFVGLYVIAQRLEEAVYIGILKVGEILFPFFSVLQEETANRRMDLFFRASWVLNLLAASALGGLIPIAGPLLNLWTGAEIAKQAQQLLVVLCIAGILGCSANVLAFYLLANGKSRSNALIALVTAAFTLVTSCLGLPHFGWAAAGWSACVGMLAQIAATFWTVHSIFNLRGIRSRFAHFVLSPLITGIVVALLVRYFFDHNVDCYVHQWWSVGLLYGLSASIVFIAIVAVSQIGPYGATSRQDLGSIANRFPLPRAR